MKSGKRIKNNGKVKFYFLVSADLIMVHTSKSVFQRVTGADQEFLNMGGPMQGGEGEYDGLLTSSVLSNCILTVLHTNNRHFRSKYELKYWHKGKKGS